MISLLNESKAFGECTDLELEQVAAVAETVSFTAGETIFEAGSPADYLYVVADGYAELRFRVTSFAAPEDIAIDRKFEGDVFGLSAATRPRTFAFMAVAGSDCDLWRIPGSDLKRMCAESDHFGHVFMDSMAGIIGQRLNILRRILIDIVQLHMQVA